MSLTWVVIKGDGDIDYTSVYVAEGVTNAQEARELELRLPEDNGDDFYRVVPLLSSRDLEDVIAEQNSYDESFSDDEEKDEEVSDSSHSVDISSNEKYDEVPGVDRIQEAYAFIDDLISKHGSLFNIPDSPDETDNKKS